MATSSTLSRASHQSVFTSDIERNLVSAFFRSQQGIFVEVGAFDPVVQSQSYHLEISGWNGVLVEPHPAQAEALRQTRRAQVFEVACVGPEVAASPVSLLSQSGWSTLHFASNENAGRTVIEVASSTLDQVLAQSGFDRVDFLSVDVEGSEPDVLRGFDFARYQPQLVLVDDFDRFGETRKVMARNRYKLVRRTGHNGWFVPHDLAFPMSVGARMQLSWAYGLGRLFSRRGGRAGERRPRPALLGI